MSFSVRYFLFSYDARRQSTLANARRTGAFILFVSFVCRTRSGTRVSRARISSIAASSRTVCESRAILYGIPENNVSLRFSWFSIIRLGTDVCNYTCYYPLSGNDRIWAYLLKTIRPRGIPCTFKSRRSCFRKWSNVTFDCVQCSNRTKNCKTGANG